MSYRFPNDFLWGATFSVNKEISYSHEIELMQKVGLRTVEIPYSQFYDGKENEETLCSQCNKQISEFNSQGIQIYISFQGREIFNCAERIIKVKQYFQRHNCLCGVSFQLESENESDLDSLVDVVKDFEVDFIKVNIGTSFDADNCDKLKSILSNIYRGNHHPLLLLGSEGIKTNDNFIDGFCIDDKRLDVLYCTFAHMLQAIMRGVPIRGFLYENPLDKGKSIERRGIAYLDEAERCILKKSGLWCAKIAKSNSIFV